MTFPLFVFFRRRDIELETGLILAGNLLIDLPKETKPNREDDDSSMIAAIIQRLTDEAQSGRMPVDAVVNGWHGGHVPLDAVDTGDDAVMAAWAKTRLIIAVRVDPRNDGKMRIDSDMLRQMGVAPEGTPRKQ
jgi:hypothetical protein